MDTVVIVDDSEAVGVGVTEELAGDDVRVTLDQVEIFAVESFLEPVQGVQIVVSLVDARRNVAEDVHLSLAIKFIALIQLNSISRMILL